MNFTPRPITDTSTLDACAAPMQIWLVALLAWMSDVLDRAGCPNHPALRAALAFAKRHVGGLLRETGVDLRMLLIAYASARLHLRAPRQRATAHPSGLRQARVTSVTTRQLSACVLSGLHHGTLRERALRLQRHLNNIEPLVARIAARLAQMLRRRRPGALLLVLSHVALRASAPPAPAFADSS